MTPPLDNAETLITILALSAGILIPRFAPFVLFARGEKLPRGILYLGGALPHAAMAMLLVYCVKDISPAGAPYGLPELLSIVFTAGLYGLSKNVLLGIGGGTLFYMAMVQMVFV